MLSLVDRLSKLREAEYVNQTQVGIRPATGADADALRAFLAGLSPSTQYLRFFTGLGSVSPGLVRDLIAVTSCQHVLLAVIGSEVVGHAMATTNRAGLLELGVVVADGHQRRGIGNGMVRALLHHAVLAGARRLHLDVLCENRRVLDWIRRDLPDIVFERDGYTLIGHAPLRLESIEGFAGLAA
jgi:GNAT superfamily N-acetyltransferase